MLISSIVAIIVHPTTTPDVPPVLLTLLLHSEVLLTLVPVCLLVAAALFGQFNLKACVATLLLSGTGAPARPTVTLGSFLSRSFFS